MAAAKGARWSSITASWWESFRPATSAGLCRGHWRVAPLCAANCQDDVSGLLFRLDVPHGGDHLLPPGGSIDDGPGLPRLDEGLEEQDGLLSLPGGELEPQPLVPAPAGEQAP